MQTILFAGTVLFAGKNNPLYNLVRSLQEPI